MTSAADTEIMAPPSAGQRYLALAAELLRQLLDEQWRAIRAAAQAAADSVAGGGLVHAFGTGHSHMLAEELFYRAGGLAAVNPILVEPLMLHAGARRSTRLERLPGLAATILADEPVRAGDTLIVASNSGGNAVCEQLAELARGRGLTVVAITSAAHAASPDARSRGARLTDLAHIVIDNCGPLGDAAVDIAPDGPRVGPTSTVAGAAIVNAIAAEAVEILTASGAAVDVFSSSNVAGGDEINDEVIQRYRHRVRSL